jgi:hypothetical protein
MAYTPNSKHISITDTPSSIHITIPKYPLPEQADEPPQWEDLVGIADDDEFTRGKTSVDLQHLLWQTPTTSQHS